MSGAAGDQKSQVQNILTKDKDDVSVNTSGRRESLGNNIKGAEVLTNGNTNTNKRDNHGSISMDFVERLNVIKAQLGDDIRRVPLHNEDITLDELFLMLQRMFKGKVRADDDIYVKYQDEDGDMITISDSSDLSFAIQCCRVLKLRIYFRKDDESKCKNVKVGEMKAKLRDLRDEVNQILDLLSAEEDKKVIRHVPTSDGDKLTSVHLDGKTKKQEASAMPNAPPIVTKEFDSIQRQQEGLSGLSSGIYNGPPSHAQIAPTIPPQASSVRQQPQGSAATPASGAGDMPHPPSAPQQVGPPPSSQPPASAPFQRPPSAPTSYPQQPSMYQQQQHQPQHPHQPSQPMPPPSQQQQGAHPPVGPSSSQPAPMNYPPSSSGTTMGYSYMAPYPSGPGQYSPAPTPQTQFSAQPRPNAPQGPTAPPQSGQPQGAQYPQAQAYPPPQQQSYPPPPQQGQYPSFPPPPTGQPGPGNPFARPPAPGPHYKTS